MYLVVADHEAIPVRGRLREVVEHPVHRDQPVLAKLIKTSKIIGWSRTSKIIGGSFMTTNITNLIK